MLFRIVLLLLALAAPSAFPTRSRAQEIIDPEQAATDPDFAVQGEYLGEGRWPGAEKVRIGAQVVALGKHTFQVVVYRGGLPGDGWKRGDERLLLAGELDGDTTKLTGKELPSGEIAGGVMTLNDTDDKPAVVLKRVERSSPTLGARPPEGAIVLFDGTNVDHFPDGRLTEMKTLQAGCTLKGKYQLRRVHLEFRTSWKPAARGQGRSNSGVYLGGIPEIQVLDSFGLEGAQNECGAFYGRRAPDVNLCLPPLVWQTYDVEFTQPAGEENVRVTVRHNGVVVHENYDTGRKELPPSGLHLQAHGNRVQYRNLWLVEAN
jgi:hypothetical protein